MRSLRIGVDLMGSDNSPEALLGALKGLPFQVVPIGLAEHRQSGFEYIEAPTFIGMDEPPLAALRRKKDCSLCIGLRLLKEKKLDAFVSAGNTGALVSASRMILGNLPGVLRPALLAGMPTKKNPVAVLDVGANVQVKSCHLVQFALLGSAYCKAKGIAKPVVGLLNIGSEAVKGTAELRAAYQELKQFPNPPFRFVGNIEGKSVFDGDVDVLITDGFTGNIFLKTAEGIASLILDRFGSLLPPGEFQKLHPKIKDVQRHLHYAEYPGALLAGVDGVVIKCHGYSTPQAFLNGVLGAEELVRGGFLQTFYSQLDKSKI
jgi:glycerol-3-phosphate acyltransferase PlsX